MLVLAPELEDLLAFHPPEGQLHVVELLNVVLFLVLQLLGFSLTLVDVGLKELDFRVDPAKAEVDAALPLLVGGLTFESEPALEDVLVSELLDIDEGLAEEIILVRAVVFVKDIHLDYLIFA